MNQISYNVDQAASQVGLKPATIKRAITSRQLKAKASSMDTGRVTGKYLIRHDDLVAWIDGMADA